MAARTGTAAADPHDGAEADIDGLVQKAAEDVFRTSQPYRYAIYLENHVGDVAGARKVLEQLSTSGDRTDRIWAYAALNNLLLKQGDFAGALRASSDAIAIDPDFNLAHANHGGTLSQLGRAGEGAAEAARAADLTRRFGARYMKSEALAYVQPMWESVVAGVRGDESRAVALDLKVLAQPGQEDLFETLATDQVALHEVTAARASISKFPGAPPARRRKTRSERQGTSRWRRARLSLHAGRPDPWRASQISPPGPAEPEP